MPTKMRQTGQNKAPLFKLSKNNVALTIIKELGVLFSNTYRKYSSEIESDVLHYNRNQNESKINVWIG